MKFKPKPNRVTEISTASLPDIVFLLLFFFMVTATIRPSESLLKVKVPEAEAISKVDRKELIRELNIGVPKNPGLGEEPRISFEDKFIQLSEIASWAVAQRESLPEAYQDQMIILLKADVEVKMGLLTDIQEELRKVNGRKILYRTLEEAN